MGTGYISNNFPYGLLNMLGMQYPMNVENPSFVPQLTNYGVAPGRSYNPMYIDPATGSLHSTLIGSVVFPGRQSPLPGPTVKEIPATWFPIINYPGSDYYNSTYDLYHAIDPLLPSYMKGNNTSSSGSIWNPSSTNYMI